MSSASTGSGRPLKVSLTGFQVVDVRACIMDITAKGFVYEGALKLTTNVLVAKYTGTTKWAAAIEAGIPVVGVMWLKNCEGGSLKDIEKFKLKRFEGLTLCTTGLSVKDRTHLEEIVTREGGTFSPNLTNAVSALIVPNGPFDETAKSSFARQQNIPLVKQTWVHEAAISPKPPTWMAYSMIPPGTASLDPITRRMARPEIETIQSSNSVLPPTGHTNIFSGIHFRTPPCVSESVRQVILENGGTAGQVYSVQPHAHGGSCEDCQVVESVSEAWIRTSVEAKSALAVQDFEPAYQRRNGIGLEQAHIKVFFLSPDDADLRKMITDIGCSLSSSIETATHIVSTDPEGDSKSNKNAAFVNPKWVRDSYGHGVAVDRCGYETREPTDDGNGFFEGTPVQETPMDKGNDLLNLVSRFEEMEAKQQTTVNLLTPMSRTCTSGKRASRMDLCTDESTASRNAKQSPLPPPSMMEESQIVRHEDIPVEIPLFPTATKAASTPRDKIVYYASGVTEQISPLLPGFVMTSDVGSATHIICGKITKSLHILAGIAGGKWLLNGSYVTSSNESGSWAQESLHVCRQTGLRGSVLSLIGSAEYWRSRQGGAYSSWRVKVLSEGSTASHYEAILVAGGAQVVDSHRLATVLLYSDSHSSSQIEALSQTYPSCAHLRADALWMVLISPKLELTDKSLSAQDYARQREAKRGPKRLSGNDANGISKQPRIS